MALPRAAPTRRSGALAGLALVLATAAASMARPHPSSAAPARNPVAQARDSTARREVTLTLVRRGPRFSRPVLDLAFMGPDHLLVLFDDQIAVLRSSGGAFVERSHEPLPGPFEPVRHPGGRLRAVEVESALWALTSRNPRAILYSFEDGRLAAQEQADALPWPGSSTGLRYRAGTDLILGTVEGLGSGPFLALAPASPTVAVTADGRLTPAGPEPSPGTPVEDLRVGAALAALWPGLLAASLPAPPPEPDAVLILAHDASGPRVLLRHAVEGTVRALAARLDGDNARLVAAVEDEHGVVLLEMQVGRRH